MVDRQATRSCILCHSGRGRIPITGLEPMVDMTRRKAIAGIGSVITVGVAGCSSSTDDGDTANSSDAGNGDSDSGSGNGGESGDNGGSIEILNHEVVEPDIGSYVEVHGEVQNNTGEEQSYIEVGAVFRDEEDTRVDDAFTNFSDVADGETLKFEIMTTLEPSEFDEYELETSTSAF